MQSPNAVDVLVELTEEAAAHLTHGGEHHFLNMHTTTPLLVLGSTVYQGEVRPEVGTGLLFDNAGKFTGASSVRVVFGKRVEDGEKVDDVVRFVTRRSSSE